MHSPKPSPSNEVLWLALALTPGLGPRPARQLVERFGSIVNVFKRTLTELESMGLRAAAAQSIALGKSLEAAESELMRATTAGARVITFDSLEYPAPLA